MNTTQNIAIIGSGISGLVSAYVLSSQHKVTVFEAGSYAGGHTNTIDVEENGKKLAVDTGFIVFNNRTYPNFIQLLDQLGVGSQETNMSFSVAEPPGSPRSGFEYASHVRGLVARKRNLFDPDFLRMLRDKFRFDALCKKALKENPSALNELTLGEFLAQHKFSDAFARYYILPMAAAVWSAPLGEITDYPMLTLTTFLSNHGLLGVNDAPTWRVVNGGSREYVRALLKRFDGELKLNTPVTAVKRQKNKVIVESSAGKQSFDHVIFACHSDQALDLLADASKPEREVLGDIEYQANEAVLHTDTRLLPSRKNAHAAWNYQLPLSDSPRATLTYNMNVLQNLQSEKTYCVTLNQTDDIDPDSIIRRIDYAHPIYNRKSVAAQARWREVSGLEQRTHFCGAYWFYGFHEDGTRSGLRVCQDFGLSLLDRESADQQAANHAA